jgi:hypothetical protein
MSLYHVFCLQLVCLITLSAQKIKVADQTYRMEGESAYVYAFAEGDQVELMVQELSGKQIKGIEFVQFPDHVIYKGYQLDSVLNQTILIPATGVYVLKFKETGLSKKICRFTLHRTPANTGTARFETRIAWDIHQFPNYTVRKRNVETGKRIEMVSLGGQVTVSASKFYTKKPVNAYQFTLPPHTKQWAYRISVGQSTQEARNADARKLASVLQTGSVKLMGVQPQTALAAFALGMAVDMTQSRSGEDVEYALTDWNNWQKFSKNEPYDAHIQQPAISVDAQRRYSPLEGTLFFALRSDNWMDDISIQVDIEVVTEVPIMEMEVYLEKG